MPTRFLILLYISYTIFIDIWSSRKIAKFQSNNRICMKNVSSNYLLSTINSKSHIVEDIEDRMIWNDLFTTHTYTPISLGSYKYLHRNYANFEEKFAICKRFYTLHSLLMYIPLPGRLVICNDNVILSDKFVFFGILPITIQWIGSANNDFIVWNNAIVKYPFGITRQLLSISEQIKKAPWRCINKFDDIYVFETGKQRRISYARIKKMT